MRIVVCSQKIAYFRKLDPIKENRTMPDLDQLYRLTRYQTTTKDNCQQQLGN
jgi:hypothetical protein